MDEQLVERWLSRRIRSMRFAVLVLAVALLAGAGIAWIITWFTLFVPLALIGLGLGLPGPGTGSTLFMFVTTIGYFFVRTRRPLPEPEVTRLADTGEVALTIPELREHWLRVRSRNQSAHLTLRSILYDMLFVTPMFLESSASVFKHWKRLGRIDTELCARALSVIHSDLDRTSFATLEARLPGVDMADLIHQLWVLDEVQFINTMPQGLILTELSRNELAAQEDAALIANVAR